MDSNKRLRPIPHSLAASTTPTQAPGLDPGASMSTNSSSKRQRHTSSSGTRSSSSVTHRALDQQAPGQIFTGLHFHTFVPAKNQLDKIKERGGIIDKTLQGTKTTHVIVRSDMSWERLCSKLTTLGFPPPPAPGPYQLSGAQLPSTVAAHFVTQDFVGRSIQTGKLLEEAAHALPVVSEYQHRCRELLEHPLPQSLPRSAAAAEAAAASAAPHAPPSVALTRFGGAQAPAGEELAPEAAGAPEQQSVFSPSLPIRYTLPGIEDICGRPAEEWGVDGRWIEPYDEAAALRTIWLLRRRWTRRDAEDIKQETNMLKAASTPLAPSASRATPQPLALPPVYSDSESDLDAQLQLGKALVPKIGRQVVGGTVIGGQQDWQQQQQQQRQQQQDPAQRLLASERWLTCSSSVLPASPGVGQGPHDGGLVRSRPSTPCSHPHPGKAAEAPGQGHMHEQHAVWLQEQQQSHLPHAKAQIVYLQRLNQEEGVVNDVCEHICCQARPFCIIKELQITHDLYNHENDPGSYRRKAILNAIHLLNDVEQPLMSEEDVQATGLTAKTLNKVVEILQTGRAGRNEAWRTGGKSAALRLYDEVWGVGPSTARAWADAGCRTLGDVRKRVQEYVESPDAGFRSCFKLTAQQNIGLRHAEEFAKPLNRHQVARVEAVVKDATIKALAHITGLSCEVISDASQEGGLHVRALGSYIRGAAVMKDVDFIVSPPSFATKPEAVARLGGSAILTDQGLLMQGLLEQLYAIKALACGAEEQLHRRKFQPEDHVTFMGVWSPQGPVEVDHHFRIDIKAYPRHQLPFAVMYFGSGKTFNRAIRFWCNKPRPAFKAYVQQLMPEATGLHLVDTMLVPEKRTSHNRHQVVGKPIDCKCESDIFKNVGLSYVPPSMRALV